jgi:hypothetical protein
MMMMKMKKQITKEWCYRKYHTISINSFFRFICVYVEDVKFKRHQIGNGIIHETLFFLFLLLLIDLINHHQHHLVIVRVRLKMSVCVMKRRRRSKLEEHERFFRKRKKERRANEYEWISFFVAFYFVFRWLHFRCCCYCIIICSLYIRKKKPIIRSAIEHKLIKW